jgi:hypothetical protein
LDSTYECHLLRPPVISSNGVEEVTTVHLERIREELAAGLDVVVRILAVATGGLGAFVFGELHQTLLARSAYGVGVASTLLHRDTGNEDGWHCAKE